MDLNGKTALVTGAAKRIGRAIALQLADRGMDVVLHYSRSKNEAEDIARRIQAGGRRAWTVGADLGEIGCASELLRKAIEFAGRLDALVNSASVFDKSAVSGFTWEELERNVRINAFAPLELARAFAAAVQTGAVVNLLDSRIKGRDQEHAAYHVSKRMLFTLTRMLAWEMAPAIRVNAVAPGLILPPHGEDVSYIETRRDENPLARFGSTQDVAEAVAFLLSSDFVTGQVIFVDGGRHMNGSFYD